MIQIKPTSFEGEGLTLKLRMYDTFSVHMLCIAELHTERDFLNLILNLMYFLCFLYLVSYISSIVAGVYKCITLLFNLKIFFNANRVIKIKKDKNKK